MIQVLIASNEEFIKREKTSATANVSSGTGVFIPVQNADNFAVNDFIVVGWEGGDNTEMCRVTGVAGLNITVDMLRLSHLENEPITKYRYNKRKFYGCTTATGTYAELSGYGSPVQIQVDDPQGTYLEYTGSEGYTYFKATYFNSVTSEETNLSDSDAVLADESSRYCSIYAIRKQAGLTNNPFMTDGMIETYRRRAENEVDSFLTSRYVLPMVDSAGNAVVPYLIENVTTLLAAGYMDYVEFGKEGQGVKWLGEARGILKSLQTSGGMQLLDSNKLEIQQRERSAGVSGYPDSVDNTNGPDRKFTMRQRF